MDVDGRLSDFQQESAAGGNSDTSKLPGNSPGPIEPLRKSNLPELRIPSDKFGLLSSTFAQREALESSTLDASHGIIPFPFITAPVPKQTVRSETKFGFLDSFRLDFTIGCTTGNDPSLVKEPGAITGEANGICLRSTGAAGGTSQVTRGPEYTTANENSIELHLSSSSFST
ncbi:hypothetical protein SADUNF_Sadunf09G0088600 [Salix dunnii]|uniref:Uncharacterized protein n=1 Tax=Salix dunnii TaxID=1413687 RepID=A0A835JRA8_9ROSI|nr:hypothetical protein SADUNF_Sadunf09G0088600 [Salix dunnii]